jgi:hypothetical protein
MAKELISQRQANFYRINNLRLMKEIASLKNQWRSDWMSGFVNIETLTVSSAEFSAIKTARLLHHALIIVPESPNVLRIYAEKV